MYYIYYEDGKLIGAGEAAMSNEDVQSISVSKSVYENFIQDREKYIYKDGKIVKNPDYDNICQKRLLLKRLEQITDTIEILDKKRIRAVCEDEIRDIRTGETWLDFYNSQIYDLRVELKSIENQL